VLQIAGELDAKRREDFGQPRAIVLRRKIAIERRLTADRFRLPA
jgi:hypothetical protein